MKILEILKNNGIVLFDGAMGTMLYSKGVPKGHCYDELNISMPEIVIDIHQEYLNAGAEVITTNTFGANRFVLEEYYDLGKKTKEINYYGARIARQVAKGNALVAGSLGPVTRPLDKSISLSPDEILEIYKEQAEGLLEGDVDIILFETHFSVDEIIKGIEAVRRLDSNIPIIAELSFPSNGLTITGENPYEVGIALNKSQANIIGSNCGRGPQSVLEVIRKIAKVTDKFLGAMPNAGQAVFHQGKFFYPENPDYFAQYAKKFIASGVQIIGGCCGTTPSHIKAVKSAIEGLIPGKRKKGIYISGKKKISEKGRNKKTHLESLLKRKFIISVEVDPPREPDPKKILDRLKELKPYIHSVNVADSPMAQARMSPVALGCIIKREIGMDVIVHFTCRDRNILGLQADLIGSSALGLNNILILTGDPPSIGDYPFATGVYDIDSGGLIEMAEHLNRGHDILKNPIGATTNFFIGCAFNAMAKDIEKEIKKLRGKIEKGARFIQTQPIFTPDRFIEVASKIKKFKTPILPSILPLINWKNAEYLHYEVPGIEIPEEYLKRMKGKTGKEGEKEGVAIAKEILKRIRNYANGVLIIPPFNKIELVQQILE